KAIFNFVFRRLGDYETARDITAETFLKAFQNISWFQWRNIPFSAWLYQIASNEINQYFRKAKYTPFCLDDLQLQNKLASEPGIETEKAALQKQSEEYKEFNLIQKHLLKLGIKYQEVIAIRFFEEKSISEISQILNKKQGTVKSLLSRGLQHLRNSLEGLREERSL
ncbi:MAG: RNA polymerase sigma factor, partial [Parafilimonas sp.]